MAENLFVIEAPGKVGHVSSILSAIGVHDAEVVATKGRLYDLPSSELGIELDGKLTPKLEPLNPAVIKYLQSKIASSDQIYIMTDADHEGELIGSHVAQLVPYYKACSRLVISSLTEDAIKKAIEEPTTIDDGMVKGATSRRIFDRICGFHLSSWADKNSALNGTVGRVLTPTLQYLVESKSKAELIIQRNYLHAGKHFSVLVSGSSADLNVKSVNQLLDSVSPTSFEASASQLSRIEPCLMDGPQATMQLAQVTGSSIVEISDSMQRLYERGLISYHRTDCKDISLESLCKLNRLAFEDGENFTIDDSLAKKPNGAHEGLHVTSPCPSVGLPYTSLTLDEKVYRLIYRSSMSLGKSLILECAAGRSSDRNIQDLKGYAGVSVQISSVSVVERGYRRTHVYSPLAGLCPELSQGWSCSPSPEHVVGKALLTLGVGRPSTFAYHSHKIAKLYLDSQGGPNFRAFASLNRAQQIAPLMLVPEKILEIDRLLLSGRPVEDVVLESFSEVGLSNDLLLADIKSKSKKQYKDSELSFE